MGGLVDRVPRRFAAASRMRRISKHTCSYVLVLISSFTFSAAVGQEGSRAEPQFVTVGVSTFRSAEAVMDDDSHAAAVRVHLESVSRESTQTAFAPLVFQLAIGNYYQVYAWLVQRKIDAAVVSAFTAALLERRNIATPIAEFHEHGNSVGHCPLVAAGSVETAGAAASSVSVGQVDGGADPIPIFRRFLEKTFTAASNHDLSLEKAVDRVREQYDVAFVSHFSSSGFIAPLLFAKSWLDARLGVEKEFDPRLRRRFWDILLGTADFSLYHGTDSNESRNEAAPNRLRFTYSGQTAKQLMKAKGRLSHWYAYDPEKPSDNGLLINTDALDGNEAVSCGDVRVSIPNDHLVVHKGIWDSIRAKQPAAEKLLSRTLTTLHSSETTPGYDKVTPANRELLRTYEQEISSLLGRRIPDGTADLEHEYDIWYLQGGFRFRISETVDILKQDASIHGRPTTLVLPGGGVKALYQAQVLDYLYSEQNLSNIATPADRDTDGDVLGVHTIVGTSGGAMVGLLAALRPGQTYRLVCEALRTGVFQFWDPLRYASFIVVGAVLMAVVVIIRLVAPQRLSSYGGWRIMPGRRARRDSAKALAILFGTPFLIHLARVGELGSITILEGFLFMVLTLLCHVVVTGGWLTSPALPRLASNKPLVETLVVAAAALFSTALVFLPEDPRLSADDSVSVSSVLFLSGSICAVVALLASPYRSADAYDSGRSQPLMPVATLLAVVVVSYATVGLLQFAGLTTLLELTETFWVSLLACSFAASTFAVVCALFFPGTLATHFWLACLPGSGFLRFSLLGKLITISICSLLLWILVVTPAIYSSSLADESYKRVLGDVTVDDLTVDLIVTGSALDRTGGASSADRYFCFAAERGTCPDREDGEWDRPKDDQWIDTVLASGAPFPIFPPHVIDIDHERVAVVDGGYTHNIPLHAAWLTRSRRALVVHSSPVAADEAGLRASPSWFPTSTLVSYANRIVPFLFDRAQEVDRLEARNMIVASLAPSASVGGFPRMTDFTRPAMELIQRTGKQDIETDARIGRFDHWGVPAFEDRLVVLVSCHT